MFTGEDIKLIRFIKSLPQKTLAENSGTSQPAVSKIEQSKDISEKTFEKYRKGANCSIEEFEKFKKNLPPPINRITELRRIL